MARKKSNGILSTFSIFFSSIKTYLLYLDQTVKYLLFPIFGQLAGIALIFTCTYYFNINSDYIRNSCPFFENDKNMFLTFCLILLPFFIIFIKAVYDYIIAFCALNILFYTNSNKKKTKNIDFRANNKVIERKIINYVILMFLVSLILIVFIIPPLIFILPFIWVFICLSFQVFSFENDISAVKAISRSIELVKGNYISVLIMVILCFVLTYCFLPELFIWAAEKISVISFLINKTENLMQFISLEELNNILGIVNLNIDTLTISEILAKNIISFIIIGFTMPFRCCCFTELYRLYDKEKIKDFSKESDEIIVRATGRKRKN